MFLTIDRDAAHQRLRACGLMLVELLNEETVELWRDREGVEIMLAPEPYGARDYEEEMIKAVEASYR